MSESSEEEEFIGDEEEEEEEGYVQEEEEEDDGQGDDDDDDNDAGGGNDGEEEESSDDEPLSNLRESSSPGRKRPVSYKEDSSSDDDDDVPLSSLAKKASPKKKAAAASPKKSTTNGKKKKSTESSPKKKKVTLKKSSSTVSNASATNKSYEFASAALYGTECEKGLLIQRLLCRWWYAYTWPDPSSIPAKPPKYYDALNGFPGVYVCTAGDNVGHIKDVRDASTAPSFRNFAKKSSDELREMLLNALDKQKQELIQHEGSSAALCKELDQLIKWTKKLNTAKADKEAAKVLKANRLALP